MSGIEDLNLQRKMEQQLLVDPKEARMVDILAKKKAELSNLRAELLEKREELSLYRENPARKPKVLQELESSVLSHEEAIDIVGDEHDKLAGERDTYLEQRKGAAH
ncbi:hypothetical protein A3F27_02560 [Candidatus Kaiserbacteria bacterium RIFCSPHIGHO2_12_FULL_53_13]|uniref:Serine-tRNA synthetase type1 N-terminal domain-containing protein n=1 Tax=Candidatus Kaiserbacteria bacterium RIFCSPHIGHO2_12_FULL_53_13 TaxID=1798502 RepID=A0A1F6E8P6_9BACT|nr:MAG: hypothetical protein A3F27_02560 [Candidatus Kaiserbacteria bacterium RIFCSPHIGHO2_12_FULL_53_13]